MVRHVGQTRTLGVLVKIHSRHDHMLSFPYLEVEATADTVAVANEPTTSILDVAKEETAASIVSMARKGATAVSASFDVEEVVVAVAVEAAALVASMVEMVGAVALPEVEMTTVDVSAEIVRGNRPHNGCGGGVW